MQVIGLTGGIASGKSTILETLKKMGAVVISADEVAHAATQPGKPAWEDIVRFFGTGILNDDKTINRKKLGEIVFNNRQYLQKLNEITHPRVKEMFKNSLKEIKEKNPDAVVVLEIPLLYEAGLEKICDEVWVVWVNRENQIRRLMAREGIDREEAVKRIEAQLPLDEKARRADFVIDNNKNVQEAIADITKYFNERVRK
ncbi:MAG: dephospho-CoA kinase [Syntrophomonadaceae bacterium]|nr:dephospho-CoA kinase [Syntrophomonadaceae bacterium]